GFKLFGGGYEHDAINALGRAIENVRINLPRMLDHEFAYGFFGQKFFFGGTHALTILAIASSLILLRHNPLWTLVVLLTVAVTLVMAPVARYYVMIVPLLMLAWMLMFIAIAQRVPAKWVEVVLVIGIAFLVGTNFSRCCKVIGEQRGWKQRGGEGSPKWSYIIEMGDLVKQLI